ncbi:MAG: hypothetical protein WA705_13375 [Candidatus Ozemobacteraceae bacterium]
MHFHRSSRNFLFGLFSLAAIALTGCTESTIFPAVVQTVVSVSPYEITPTAMNASGTVTVSQLTIALKTETGVPSRIVSYSIAYATNLGQPISQLRVEETPYDLYLAPSVSTNIPVTVYSQRVADLYAQSTSDISPIRATVILTVKDVNGNTVKREASCLLYKF